MVVAPRTDVGQHPMVIRRSLSPGVIEPLLLREEQAHPGLVIVRLGTRSLEDPMLSRSIDECHSRWGKSAFQFWKFRTATSRSSFEFGQLSP